jgi:hypothetical protein
VFGPLFRPREVVLSCDRPQPLPALSGVTRPSEGCFLIRESTYSAPPETLWERLGDERILDLGRPRDAWGALDGFHERETDARSGLTMRWTSGRSSFVWVPVPGVFPREIALRAKAPGAALVSVAVSIGGVPAGRVNVLPGDFGEARLTLDEAARKRMAGGEPVRVALESPVFVPKATGVADDTRELGIVLDRVVVR